MSAELRSMDTNQYISFCQSVNNSYVQKFLFLQKRHLKNHYPQEELKQRVAILESVSLLGEYVENNDT